MLTLSLTSSWIVRLTCHSLADSSSAIVDRRHDLEVREAEGEGDRRRSGRNNLLTAPRPQPPTPMPTTNEPPPTLALTNAFMVRWTRCLWH